MARTILGRPNWLGRFSKKILVVMMTIIICSVILEIGLRIMGRLPSNVTDGIFRQAGNSYRLKRNQTKVIKIPSYACTIYINSLGFRDNTAGDRTIGPNPYIVFLGESLTFANGVDYDQSFVGIIAQKLNPANISVVNLAIGGHLFMEQVDTFREFLNSVTYTPSKVLICFTPALIQGFDLPFSDIVVKNGYLFNKENWLLPYIRIALGNASAAYCYFRDNIRRIQGWLFSKDLANARQILSSFSKSHRFRDQNTIKKFEESLDSLNKLIDEVGASPIYLYLPLSTDFRVDYFLKQAKENPDNYDFFLYLDLFKSYCHRKEIPLIDLYPALNKLHENGTKLDFSQDLHYNIDAHKSIGEAIFELMSSINMFNTRDEKEL